MCFSLVLFLFFTAVIFSQDIEQEKTEEKRPPVGLIRKDLLALEIKKLDPPKRNIFTPNSAGMQEIDEFEEMNEIQRAEQQNIEALEAELSSVRALGLRFIGYVKSGQKITALILFEGEALAVDVGEEIAEGVSISKITLEDITVIGPDQEPRKFPLEGETP
jgi:Tfp pilus assembly protein PilP